MCLQNDSDENHLLSLFKVCASRPALIRLVTKMRQNPPSVSAIHQPIHHDFSFDQVPQFYRRIIGLC